MSTQRKNATIVVLAAAIVVPRIQQWTGIKLTVDDVADMVALGITVWHGAATVLEHYFPPKIPFTTPVEPAKE